MPFETFTPFKQPPEKDAETLKANEAVVEALLGKKQADKYRELTKGDVVDATPPLITAEDLAKVAAMQEAERNREKKAEKTKRLWMVWANRFNFEEEYIIEHARFQENGEVVWDGDCDWNNKGLTEFPPNFVEVTGDFWCGKNQLTSLEGSPQIVGESFDCEGNQLTSLEGTPQTVGGNFYCGKNQLTSLEGAPQTVGRDFSCSNNQLTSLEGCPQTVGGNFFCYNNPLLTTFPAGIHIGGLVYISEDQLQLKADAESKGYEVLIY